MEGNVFQAGSWTPAGGPRKGPRRSSQGGGGGAGEADAVASPPNFEFRAKTKTDQEKSMGVIYNNELGRDEGFQEFQ